VDAVVTDVRDKAARRETDIRRLGLELDQIRESIPKALESVKHAQTESLNELNNELRSLKTLLQNRTKAQDGAAISTLPGQRLPTTSTATGKPSTTAPGEQGSAASQIARPVPDSLSRFTSGSAAGSGGIPAWQLSTPEPETKEASV
jgi:peroxin-14